MISEIDRAVGEKIAAHRKLLRISQSELGYEIGVVAQQISRYELGVSKVPASVLWHIAQLLHADFEAFFPEQGNLGVSERIPPLSREIIDLVNMQRAMPENIKAAFKGLVKTIHDDHRHRESVTSPTTAIQDPTPSSHHRN